MTIYLRVSAAALALAISSPAFAQESAASQTAVQTELAAAPAADAAPVSAPADAVAPAANILAKGTEIEFRTLTPLTSKENKVGDRFDLEVVRDVTVGNYIIIPAGAHAVGKVTFMKKKGGWGKSGKIEASVDSVNVNGVDIAVHGMVGDKGKAGGAAVVGAVLFSPIIVAPFVGFFVTGTSAVVPVGAPAFATLDADLAFDPVTAPVAQMAAADVAAPPAEPAAAPAAAEPAAPASGAAATPQLR